MIFKGIIILGFVIASSLGTAQCNILNRVYPDGSIMYYMESVKFYWTESKALYGNVVTDKEHYFLEFQPVPFPTKQEGKKLKDDIELTLSNDAVIKLMHYDTRYVANDSIMELMFILDKKDIEAVLLNEATAVSINMKGEEGVRSYFFKLHKTAIQDQLACFLTEEKKKKN